MSATATASTPGQTVEVRASWLPLIVVVLTQIQASFAVNALTVSMGGITTDLNTPATTVGTAITAGTFAMAAFILLGAKIGAKFGSRRVFQIALVVHAASMAGVALAQTPTMLFTFQAASGAVIALIAPALVVFIAGNFKGKQQAQAIGFLAAAIPASGVLALLTAGSFASTIGWRYSFALVSVLGLINLLLSFRLKKVPAIQGVAIDGIGAMIAAVSVILLSFGFSGLSSWGILLATPNAPFNLVGLSPALVLIVLGIVGAQGFFMWTRNRKKAGKSQLFNLDVLKEASDKATTFAMSAMLFVGTAANFLIPLYLQIVQGRTSFETSIAVIPYTLSIFVASSVVAGLYSRFAPRQIARFGFILVAVALTLLAFTIRNEWEQIVIILGLILLGLGQGSIVALVFNTLLASSPKELAGDVGAWRGLVHNLSGSVGIAVASVFAVGVLSASIGAGLAQNSTLPPALTSQVNLDNTNFVTNAHLKDVLSQTSATPEQVAAAVALNEDARLRALQISLLALASIAVLAIIPASRMPGFTPGDIPAELSTGREIEPAEEESSKKK